MADYNKRLEKLEIGLLKVSKKVPNEPKEVTEEKKKNFMLLMQGKSQMKQSINDLEIKKRRLDATMECEGCSIVVKKIIHTGVRVTIGTATLRINGHKEVQTFVEEDGVIKAFGVVV
ncbi:MAG: FapA family protein [Acetivibrio ethanolgignens]